MTTIYIGDPLKYDINPGEDSDLKLFSITTAERSKDAKLTICQGKASRIMSTLNQDSNSFG